MRKLGAVGTQPKMVVLALLRLRFSIKFTISRTLLAFTCF